jgi:peptide/nickel transport system substrate-binding protein
VEEERGRMLREARSMGRVLCVVAFTVLTCLVGCKQDTDNAQSGLQERNVGCGRREKDRHPTYGGMIVIGSISEASVLLPVLAPDMPSRRIAELIFNGLVKYDKDLRLVGDLAERWEMSKDKTIIRFYLRRDVTWHDGKPFTARDVEYTYEVYCDPKTPTPYASDFLRVKEFRVLDNHTVEVVYDRPYSPALGSWVEGILPRHLLEGTDITKSDLLRHPVGTGPYKFVEWEHGERIVLDANPHYFRGRPYIRRVMIRFVLDKATSFLALQSGTLDMATITPMQYSRQSESSWFKQNFNKHKFLAHAYTYLAYNLQDWKFKDKRVRQALTMAIDREAIVKVILLGLGRVVDAPYNPDTFWYNHKVLRFPYNPEKARRLLAAAGWKDRNDDGVIDKDGIPFAFTILTNHGDDRRMNAATMIQYYLRKVGINVEVRVLEWAALLHNFLYKRNFEACIMGWALDFDPNQMDKWHSSMTGPYDYNWMHYQNKEVDRLLELGVSTYDRKERKSHYDRIQDLLAEDQPCTFLWVHDALYLVHSRFCGIELAPIGIDYNLPKWYVPQRLQQYFREPVHGGLDR